MEIHAINILYDFCLMSALLFVAKIIRAKVKLVQKLYIPSALIAGVLGLFFGHQFLDVIPFSSEISSYSGMLIAVLFATMFLGKKEKASFKKMISNVGDTFLVNTFAEVFQYGLFIIIGVVLLPLLFSGINSAFGLMLPAGFIGGHGSAAAIGSALADNGWDEATSIGQTFATVGLILGIVCGVLFINIAARRGYTKVVKGVDALPEEMLTGLIPQEKRNALGDETVSSMSIDSISWHLSLVLAAVGSAYLINMGLVKLLPSVSFPVYGLALICSVIIQWVLRLIKMDEYVDKRTVTHIGSSATDYLVGFGVASINISIVVKYWLPILLLVVLGFALVAFVLFFVSRKFFRNYWFERGIYIYGMSTGVMATGVILLRIVDPKFETGVLEDFGFAWIFLTFIDLVLVSFSPLLIAKGYGLLFGLAAVAVAIICLVLCRLMFKRTKVEE